MIDSESTKLLRKIVKVLDELSLTIKEVILRTENQKNKRAIEKAKSKLRGENR